MPTSYSDKRDEFLVSNQKHIENGVFCVPGEWLQLKNGDVWVPSFDSCAKSFNVPQCLLSKHTSATGEHHSLATATTLDVSDNSNYAQATLLSRQWTTLQLEDFMNCTDNPAANRQVRMFVSCDVRQQRNGAMLAQLNDAILMDAKRNLRQLSFFGLTEYQELTDKLFEFTFGTSSGHLRQSLQNRVSCLDVDAATAERISRLNRLDVEFYNYAKELFFERARVAGLL